jgi:proteic killer suppression protein
MKIRNVIHKGLRRFIETTMKAASSPPLSPRCGAWSLSSRIWSGGRAAQRSKLEGAYADRRPQGTWSLFVTKNWRMTFRIDRNEIEIIDLDYEDYH